MDKISSEKIKEKLSNVCSLISYGGAYCVLRDDKKYNCNLMGDDVKKMQCPLEKIIESLK